MQAQKFCNVHEDKQHNLERRREKGSARAAIATGIPELRDGTGESERGDRRGGGSDVRLTINGTAARLLKGNAFLCMSGKRTRRCEPRLR